MIYLDTSVALAQLLSEDRRPPPLFWKHELISSRLLQYEVWTRLFALKAGKRERESASALLTSISLVEMTELVLARALEPYPLPVRTLDSLHLATVEFVRAQGYPLELASYDARMVAAANSLGIPIFQIGG